MDTFQTVGVWTTTFYPICLWRIFITIERPLFIYAIKSLLFEITKIPSLYQLYYNL